MFKTTTVEELIEALQEHDPKAFVVFASDYGDRGNTMQVHAIDGDVDEIQIRKTAYSASGWAVLESDDMREEDANVPCVLLIS